MSVHVRSEKELRDVLDLARSEGWTQLAIARVKEKRQIDALREEFWPEDRIIICDDFTVSDWCILSSLTALTSLNLWSNQIGDKGASALSPLTALISLNLGFTYIGAEGARALSSLTALTSLDLADNQIGAEGARALSSLTALTSLDLWNCGIEDEGACALSSLTALTSLNLWRNQIESKGARALSSLTALTSLDLQHSIIRADGARALSSLTALTLLNLGQSRIGDDGARALSCLTALTSLNLASNQIGDEGASALSSLTALTWLDLEHNRIGAEGARALSSLTALTSLRLGINQIRDEGARALSSLTALTYLDLHACALTRFPVELLNLNDLREINLQLNPIVDLAPELWSDERNCLPAVGAHFADLKQGAEADRELKLILLGNGRVGKTSIVRFLMKEPFDKDESSTHGIQLRARIESLDGHDVRVNLWDFGGQDIYFNTHALFLKSRAVFMIVWDAETERQLHYVEGELQFENRPLQYWLDYVRAVSPDSAVIVVQNKCDDGKGIDPEADLGSAERTTFSALNHQLNGEALIGILRGAIRRTMQHPASYRIGRGRWRVKQQIRKWLDEDDERAPKEPRQHQLLSYPDFLALCDEEPGTVSSPDLLLQFLDDTGVVYYQSELFNDQIILDQRWAIEAIYTIFHRKKCYRQLRERGGRFRLQDLADLAWDEQGFSADEQRLFLSFMESCSICFEVGGDDEDPIYLAPQLMPALDELPSTILRRRQERLESVDRGSASYYRFQHRFLHEGIMMRFMARIGNVFGDSAIYWRDGVQIDWPIQSDKPATMDRAVAEIVCHHKLENNPARGEIVMTAWGAGRKELLIRLRTAFGELHASERGIEEAKSIDGTHWIDSHAGAILKSIHEVFPAPSGCDDKERFGYLFDADPQAWLSKLREIEMGEDASKTPAIYISYAWGDSDETGPESRVDIVDRLYESLKNDGFDVRRDKHNVQYKGDLNAFTQEIGRAPCVVAVVSDKSLRSPWCMYELLETHRNLQFRERIFPIVLSDAKIHRLTDRLGYIAHWKKEYKDLEAQVSDVGIDVLRSTGSFQEYERIRDIAHGADELLTILGTMNTSKPIDLEANNFELLKQSIIEWFEKLGGRRQ